MRKQDSSQTNGIVKICQTAATAIRSVGKPMHSGLICLGRPLKPSRTRTEQEPTHEDDFQGN